MPTRVELAQPPEDVARYSRTMNEAFGPYAHLTLEEHEYSPKRELRAVIICLVLTVVLGVVLACVKGK